MTCVFDVKLYSTPGLDKDQIRHDAAETLGAYLHLGSCADCRSVF